MDFAAELFGISGDIRKEKTMGATFWDTVAGLKFTSVTVPKLINKIERLNNNLEKIINSKDNDVCSDREKY